ncbi:MAG: XTP/dITP diphosphatase [Elusimicrobia bacterium]|nr:XTP/dITP diphosphatase [Candidatus Liberimonas magnetica]
MREIVLSTRNKHKIKEICQILEDTKIKIVSLNNFKRLPRIIEDGKTLKENAVKKAVIIAKRLEKWTLADDSGLEVDHLDGEPGVYSARWAGKDCSYCDNNRKLLKLLRDVPKNKRKADFKCVIALSNPKGKTWTVEGKIKGYIAKKTKGINGFGYDPLFVVPRYKKTFAELSSVIKNRISHRAKALKKTVKLVNKLIVN